LTQLAACSLLCNLAAKLCQDVLGALVDGAMPFSEAACDVVKDALVVLASKEIKLAAVRKHQGAAGTAQ